MATSTTVSLETLLNEALGILYRPTERPMPVVVAANALSASTSDIDLTLASSDQWNSVQVSDILENGQELMLVTAKSADAIPVFTLQRAYAGTPVTAATTGTTLLKSPLWTRYELRRAILRALKGTFSTYIPCVTSRTETPVQNQYWVEVPETTVDVFRVGLLPTTTVGAVLAQKWRDIHEWEFVEDVPTTVSSTGKMVTIPPWVSAAASSSGTTWEVYLTYQIPYAWSAGGDDPAESATISVPFGAEDILPLYAAAYSVMNREVTRMELDKIEEWSQEAAIRQGVNLRLATALWSQFYRRVDEVRRKQRVPRHRPYRPWR